MSSSTAIQSPSPTLTFDRVTVIRYGTPVLHDITWSVRPGENWAVVGPNGAGKSALAAAIAGETHYSGEIHYAFADRDREPYEKIAWVSFSHHRRLVAQRDGYYQSRWYSGMEEATLTARQILRQSAGGVIPAEHRVAHVARVMSLSRLLDLQALHLSTGEMRRVLIARALLRRPALLLLDEPFVGLDVACRGKLAGILKRLMRHGQQTLFFTARPWELPDGFTHTLWLRDGAVVGAAPRGHSSGRRLEHAAFRCVPPSAPPMLRSVKAQLDGSAPVVELRNVSLRTEEKLILNDINWTVRAGERWALIGPNGAGKTALISLLTGDHPQSFAQHVRLFGHSRNGQTLWEWKGRIGWAAPDLALHYDATASTLSFVGTGFHDALTLSHRCSPTQQRLARRWVRYFGLNNAADVPFRLLSDGQQRLALVARALVKSPPLLILDEPCQGLDAASRRLVLAAVETICKRARTTLVIVTHYADELPAGITHRLELRKGRIARSGKA